MIYCAVELLTAGTHGDQTDGSSRANGDLCDMMPPLCSECEFQERYCTAT